MATGAVIVAAGMSRRMQECKQLMKIGGFTMAERIIRIQSGKILSNQVNNHIIPIEMIEW